MITYCASCAAPLSTTDTSCPSCGATATPQRAPTAAMTGAAGRQPVLGPVTGGPTGPPVSAATPGAPSRTAAMPGGAVVPGGAAVPGAGRAGGPVATGTITSSVTCDQLTTTGTGQWLLVFAVSLTVTVALAMLATLVFVGGLLTWVGALAALLPFLLVLGAMLLFLRMMPFGWVLLLPFQRRRRGGGSGRLAAGAARGLTRIVVAPMRAGSSLQRELSTEVRRFRVTEVSGRHVDCELVGELAGASPQQGDIVDIFGRMTRRGAVRVRAVFVTSNQSRITARPHFGFVVARIANVAAVMLSIACVIGVAYLLVTR